MSKLHSYLGLGATLNLKLFLSTDLLMAQVTAVMLKAEKAQKQSESLATGNSFRKNIPQTLHMTLEMYIMDIER